MTKFEEFLNQEVDPVKFIRGVYLASLSLFIFTTLFTAGYADLYGKNMASVAMANKEEYALASSAADISSKTITTKLSATSESIRYNNETTVMWRTTNAESCVVKKNGEIFSNEINGNKITGKLKKDTKFTISCSSKTSKAEAILDIKVGKQTTKPTLRLFVTPTYVDRDGVVKITWSSKLADRCVLMQGESQLNTSLSGNMSSHSIGDATVIWLKCTNSGGSVVSSYNVQLKN